MTDGGRIGRRCGGCAARDRSSPCRPPGTCRGRAPDRLHPSRAATHHQRARTPRAHRLPRAGASPPNDPPWSMHHSGPPDLECSGSHSAHALEVEDVLSGASEVHVHQTSRRHGVRHQVHQAGFNALYRRSLIYNQCWEDPALDYQALDLDEDSEVLVITSAGCNALNYLVQGVRSVHAVDANPLQTAVLELKLAAARHLDWPEFFQLFGEGRHPRLQGRLPPRPSRRSLVGLPAALGQEHQLVDARQGAAWLLRSRPVRGVRALLRGLDEAAAQAGAGARRAVRDRDDGRATRGLAGTGRAQPVHTDGLLARGPSVRDEPRRRALRAAAQPGRRHRHLPPPCPRRRRDEPARERELLLPGVPGGRLLPGLLSRLPQGVELRAPEGVGGPCAHRHPPR